MDSSVGQSQPAPFKPGMPDRRQRKPDVWSRVFRYLTVLVYPLMIVYFLVFAALGDRIQRGKIDGTAEQAPAEVVRGNGGYAILAIMVAGVAIGAIGLFLSFKRARRRSDYNYQTQLLLVILSVGGLAIFFVLH